MVVRIRDSQHVYKLDGNHLHLPVECSLAHIPMKLRHLQSKLALRLRTRLTRYTHDLYLSSSPSLRYYRITQPGGLEGVDQYMTSDIAASTLR